MIDHFDNISKRYYSFVDRVWYDAGYFHARELRATEALARGLSIGRILDAGCGPGRHTQSLLRLGHQVVALDFSREMLLETRKRLSKSDISRMDLVRADLRALPFRGQSFDGAVCMEVLEHLPVTPSSLSEALGELSRVTMQQGRLLIEAPLTAHGIVKRLTRRLPSWKELTSEEWREYYETKPLLVGRGFPASVVRTLLHRANLSLLGTSYVRVIPSGLIETCPGLAKLDSLVENIPVVRSFAREAVWLVTPTVPSAVDIREGKPTGTSSRWHIDFIRFLGAPWKGLWQRPQQLMVQFSRNHKVLYVDPPSRRPRLIPLRRVSKNLWLLRPWSITLRSNSALKEIEDTLLGFLVRFASKLIGLERIVVWHSEYTTSTFIGKLGETLNLYDCCDDFVSQSEFPEAEAKAEEHMLSAADAALVTSLRLLEKKRYRARRVLLVPNGADVENLRPSPALSDPADLIGIARPRLGFVGAFHDWVDVELIATVARARADWSFVIIGPGGASGEKLHGLGNVHFLGCKEYADLPAYYAHIDVGIVPFAVSEFTECVDPIKVYEYLAMGKPVVATELSEMAKFGNLVYVAKTKQQFAARIEEALRAPADPQGRRRAWATANSWSSRAALVEEFIASMLDLPGRSGDRAIDKKRPRGELRNA